MAHDRYVLRDSVDGLIEAFGNEIGRPPTVYELVEVFSRSIPVSDTRLRVEVVPARMIAKKKNRRVSGDVSDVDELSDSGLRYGIACAGTPRR